MITIQIDDHYCKGCNLCVNVCPKGALTKGQTRNSKGYHMPEANPDSCVACKTCEQVCPDMAISVIKEG